MDKNVFGKQYNKRMRSSNMDKFKSYESLYF